MKLDSEYPILLTLLLGLEKTKERRTENSALSNQREPQDFPALAELSFALHGAEIISGLGLLPHFYSNQEGLPANGAHIEKAELKN